MSPRKELRDYEELLEFARQELRQSQQQLIRMRNLEADPDQLEKLEKEIELLIKAVDRYQVKIKVLQNALRESENQS
ncbi:PCRF domain-containing protein [Cyclobacterium salsum]|uniref:PCRF domain-containing protein n=1 Tax=Cyclobacterium salsum TaxID=2666329 RepID=UPI001391508D|nr:PCRF domain-containing protein [Cyclobacterium salsum]